MTRRSEQVMRGEQLTKRGYQIVFWLRRAADAGSSDALCNLGNLHFHGQRGVTQDLDKGLEYFEKAGDKGNVLAMYNVGSCYLQGMGVLQDEDLGLHWLKKAADAGDLDSAFALGNYCLSAARGGDASGESGDRAGGKRQKLTGGAETAAGEAGEDVFFERALYYFHLGSEGGHLDCRNNLGLCYYHGLGTERDLAKAKSLLLSVAEAGDEDARVLISQIEKEQGR